MAETTTRAVLHRARGGAAGEHAEMGSLTSGAWPKRESGGVGKSSRRPTFWHKRGRQARTASLFRGDRSIRKGAPFEAFAAGVTKE